MSDGPNPAEENENIRPSFMEPLLHLPNITYSYDIVNDIEEDNNANIEVGTTFAERYYDSVINPGNIGEFKEDDPITDEELRNIYNFILEEETKNNDERVTIPDEVLDTLGLRENESKDNGYKKNRKRIKRSRSRSKRRKRSKSKRRKKSKSKRRK